MRIDLPDGQWAEVRERLTHGEDKALRRVTHAGKTDPALSFDVDTALVRTFVSDWYVLDLDGKTIALSDPDAIDRAPGDIIDILAERSAEQWIGATQPDPPTPA